MMLTTYPKRLAPSKLGFRAVRIDYGPADVGAR
jgi:hypothetical protein